MMLSVLCLTGCSDDGTGPLPDSSSNQDQGSKKLDKGPQKDGGSTSDKGAKPDKGAPLMDSKTSADKSTPKDAGTAKLSCSGIGACSDVCAAKCPGGLGKLTCMMKCSTDCKAKGCASAQAVYTPLYNCINLKCMLECMGGPSKGCKDCVDKKCANEVKACNANKC